MAITLNVLRNGASLLANAFGVGFIDWLDADARLFYACPDDLLFLVLCVCRDEVIGLKVRDDEPQLLVDHILHAGVRPCELEY